jgi:hypothetical protein
LRKWGVYFYVITFDNYVQAFEHNSLYWAYLNGVPLGKALNKNELHVHKAKESRNQLLLTVVVTNYAPSCSYA